MPSEKNEILKFNNMQKWAKCHILFTLTLNA